MQPNPLEAIPEVLMFARNKIRKSEIFAASESSFAFVNLKPLVPGHVLVSPQRVCDRFKRLTAAEVADLWQLAQRVGDFVEEFFQADSISLVIQDGPAAGQTVPHVHIHCLPRHTGDLEHNDEVYDRINEASKQEASARFTRDKKLDLDQQVVVKTLDEMSAEAERLRVGMAEWQARRAAQGV